MGRGHLRDAPVADPDLEGTHRGTGETHGAALETLEGSELPTALVPQGEVGKPDIPRGPAAGPCCGLFGLGLEGVAEDRQLKAEGLSRDRGQVTGEVPPLGAEVRMGSVVLGKDERTYLGGPGEALGVFTAHRRGDR